MDAEIELMVKNCEVCQSVRRAPPRAPLYPWRWPTSAERTIDQLRAWFMANGLPEEVVTDNGPQFIASEFVNFLKQNGVKQTLVPP